MYVKWADVEVGDLVYGQGFYRTVAEVDHHHGYTYLTFVVEEGERKTTISESSLSYIAVEAPSGIGGCEVGVGDLLASWMRVRRYAIHETSESIDAAMEEMEAEAKSIARRLGVNWAAVLREARA